MITLNKLAGVFILCMLLSVVCFSQEIKGTVVDSLNKPVPLARVNLKNKADLIIGFTNTNDKGLFTLSIPLDADKTGLYIEVNALGFEKQIKPVSSFTAPYNFKLNTAINQLKAVTIENNRPRVRTNGDTLSYKAADFTSSQDRVIGDIIKKLPGIAVASDGKISYNGKVISNLYIGGDNLLDDKYNIAINNIPNNMVDEVQIMENHQPIQVMKDKVVSDEVALNITIKKGAKLQIAGQEIVGAGLPGNYYANLNLMIFKDNYKAINYLKGNNTGLDVQGDMVLHSLSDYLAKVDNDKPITFLSLGTAGNPDLPRNRYLFDQSGVINTNNLLNLNDDVQLCVNLSYLHDNQRQDYRKISDIFLPKDTVHYTETQNTNYRPDILHTQFTLNINKPQYYLNDYLITDYSHNTNYSSLIANGTPVNQVFKDNLLDFSNEFNMIRTFESNNIIEVYTYINKSNEPENRIIYPGLSPGIFNNNINYSQLTQNVNVPTIFINSYISYKIPGHITQSYKAGLNGQTQTLLSNFSVTQLNNVNNLQSDSARNSLTWARNKLYTEADYDMTGKILNIALSLPLTWVGISYNDPFYNLNKSLNRLCFDPRIYIKYQTGIENYMTINYNLKNNIGGIQDMYRGDILTNYRTIYANNADLTQRQTQTAALGFNYRKAITLFFFSANAVYIHQNANNITSSILTNNIQQRIVLPFDNNMDSWLFNGFLSKYSFAIRTTFSGGVSLQTTKINQIQNGIMLPYNTINSVFGVGADTKVSDKINFSYKANYTQTIGKSLTINNSSNAFERLIQTAAINYNPLNNLFFNVSGDHYYTRQQQTNDLKYIFADASIRYRFIKTKLDVELSAQNLYNTQNYTAVYLSANVYTSSNYTIPGRILLAKLMFSL